MRYISETAKYIFEPFSRNHFIYSMKNWLSV